VEPLKNHVARPVVEMLAERFEREAPDFVAEQFVSRVVDELPALELKDRINLIATELRWHLDKDYVAALGHVVAVAKSGVEGFAAWPLCSFVELFGVDHPNESLAAMEHLTQRMSCEFAIRPFLDQHLAQTVSQLESWTGHPDAKVRRLVSEGTRPRLPWGPRVAALLEDPTIGLELIERLRHDESEDVRRSVANHLNDIAKDHPELVLETTARWAVDGVDGSLISHALRTLVKKGDSGALQVLGFTTDPAIVVNAFNVEPSTLKLGESVELVAEVASEGTGRQRLAVDFVIHHPSRSGGTSTKVFKWKTLELEPGESAKMAKRRLIQNQSTRTYHGGRHTVELQIAGQIVAASYFTVVV